MKWHHLYEDPLVPTWDKRWTMSQQRLACQWRLHTFGKMPKNASKNSLTRILVLILAGESIFFLPFVIPRVFRATVLEVFQISNLELGGYFSIYGVVAMISYFFGGPLADKYPARNLMAFALWLTGIGGLLLSGLQKASMLPYIYSYWGFTTIFLFWAALIRATREWGGGDSQGRAFGFLEGGRGLMAALIGFFSVTLFAILMPDSHDAAMEMKRFESFRWVLISTSLIVILVGGLVWFFIPKEVIVQGEESRPTFRNVFHLLKKRRIWLQALIIVCAYVGYKITDDYALYAREVLGFSEVNAARVGGGMLWLRALFALLAGLMMDRIGGHAVVKWCFLFVLVAGSWVALGWRPLDDLIIMMNLIFVLVGVYGLRGVYYALMNDAKVPMGLTGSAVGILSVVGYTPDVFMSPLMGYLLDNNPGQMGHQLVFVVLVSFSVIGLVSSLALKRII